MVDPMKFSPNQRRRAQEILRIENEKYPAALRKLESSEWPQTARGIDVVEIWRSRDFLVHLYRKPFPIPLRLSINRTMINDDGNWVDGITWDDIQRLKREAGFGDRDAVEVYPADSDIVNVANIRHLWIMPVAIPWAWGGDGKQRKQSL